MEGDNLKDGIDRLRKTVNEALGNAGIGKSCADSLLALADQLDDMHESAIDHWCDAQYDTMIENPYDFGIMERPKDANGEYWRIGDVAVCDGCRFTVENFLTDGKSCKLIGGSHVCDASEAINAEDEHTGDRLRRIAQQMLRVYDGDLMKELSSELEEVADGIR